MKNVIRPTPIDAVLHNRSCPSRWQALRNQFWSKYSRCMCNWQQLLGRRVILPKDIPNWQLLVDQREIVYFDDHLQCRSSLELWLLSFLKCKCNLKKKQNITIITFFITRLFNNETQILPMWFCTTHVCSSVQYLFSY